MFYLSRPRSIYEGTLEDVETGRRVCAYAVMSNLKVERTVGTIKKAFGRLVEGARKVYGEV